jgi:hypothetical protein
MAYVKLPCDDDIFMGIFKKGVIIMMLFELFARLDEDVRVKCMIRNEKTVNTIEGSCLFVHNKLNQNGLMRDVLYIDLINNELIVRAE